MPDSPDDIFPALLDRYHQLCAERDNAQENIERMQAHQRQLVAQINDCLAAARVFNRDLGPQAPAREWSGKPFHAPSMKPRQGAVTIRGLVLDAVEKAHPNPTRAADIHRQLVGAGHLIHEKTVGMTLYRWSLENRVRRQGRLDWYFVPPGERMPMVSNGELHALIPNATASGPRIEIGP